MTFAQLDETLKSRLEQLGYDAGAAWIDDFVDERNRAPEPEETADEAQNAVETHRATLIRAMVASGVKPTPDLMVDVERVFCQKFSEALDA